MGFGWFAPGAALALTTLAARPSAGQPRTRAPHARGGVVCVLGGEAALRVAVLYARTGAPRLAGATLTMRDGAFVERHALAAWAAGPAPARPTTPILETFVSLGTARPGTYAVRVVRPGYRAWDTAGVRVTRGPAPCHYLRPAFLRVRLRPA